jgi:pyrroloquinoline quinone biosynthesis protein D
MIKGKIILAPGHRIQYEPSQNQHVLLYPEGLVELGDTAQAILTRCRAETTFQRLVQDLEEEFQGQSLTADVTEFLEEARARGWIHVST